MRSKAAGWLAVAAIGATVGLGGPVAAANAAGSARAATTAPPNLDVSAAAMIEASTGQTVYALHPERELAIASTTKIMTALVTLEHARLGEVFADPPYYLSPVDSQIGLAPGERMTVHDLMIAMLLPSADDAAEDLASGVGGGSVPRFVAMMNAQARKLGLLHTHYSTPIGLDTPGNYSSASDLVALTRFVMSTEPFFRQTVARSTATIRVGEDERQVANLNTLVGSVPWITGVKTGHTVDAGYVLVGSGTRDGMTLISAVLGAPTEDSRETDTLALLRYGFAAFRLATPVRAGAVLARPTVSGFTGQRADLVAARTFTKVFPRSSRIRVVIHAPSEVTGPLRARVVLGSALVLAAGHQVARVPLLLARRVAAPPSGVLLGLGSGASTLLLLGLLLIIGGIVWIRRSERRTVSPAPSHRPE